MVQVAKYCFLLFATMMLLSCANLHSSQDLSKGKYYFKQGEYKKAFHRLLPQAVNGQREAQYAVGYMYYYGYGVSRDAESGIFWMEKSADQHYPPAIRALQLIHQEPIRERESVEVYHAQPTPYKPMMPPSQDEVMDTLPKQPVMRVPVHHPPPPPHQVWVMPESKNFREEIPVMNKQPQPVAKANFSLQLFGAYQLSSVKTVQAQLSSDHGTHIWHTEHEGKDWYVLTYGNFASAHLAAESRKHLSSEFSDFSPWIRKMEGLQAV